MRADLINIADAPARARAGGTRLPIPPDGIRTIDDAYDVQAELIRRAGGVLGWKVTAVTPEAQASFGTNGPVRGALLPRHVHASPAELALPRFIDLMIECEIAFVLGSDLPRRDRPHARAQVEAAITAVVPAFEFPDTRLPAEASDVARLAGVMANGSFVTGKPVEDWRGLDLFGLPIELFRDSGSVARGSGAAVPGGDPLGAVVAFANARAFPFDLKAGQVITTGTCTTPLPVAHGAYRATFGPLGSVEVAFTGGRRGNEAT